MLCANANAVVGQKLGDARKLIKQLNLTLERGKTPRHRAESDTSIASQ
jgi:hypothetical protein